MPFYLFSLPRPAQLSFLTVEDLIERGKYHKIKKMKITILTLSMILVFMGQNVISQEWAPEGAEWHYSFGAFEVTGYVKIVSDGDTVINGQQCKILSKTATSYNYITEMYDSAFIGNEYTWSGNDKVYIYKNGQFYTLYDFSAQPGDSWIIPATHLGYCDTTGTMVVDSIGSIVINSMPLRVIYCNSDESSHWFLGSVIIEKIGPVNSYMLPNMTINCGVADLFDGGPLRCYSDNGFGLYETGIAPSCGFIVGVEVEEDTEGLFRVFPNPAENRITIVSESQITKSIEIMDIYGQPLKKINTDEKRVLIDISGFSKGVYFMQTKYANKKWTYKFIKD
ncbi:MAG: hypothetical protein DRJ05_16385 [Bacteroidetes bacterium]|nr:MAG: hypothetical protein DRJ05_16385 [Bacteroidota bacterium]